MAWSGATLRLTLLSVLGDSCFGGRRCYAYVPICTEGRFEGCEEAGPCLVLIRGGQGVFGWGGGAVVGDGTLLYGSHRKRGEDGVVEREPGPLDVIPVVVDFGGADVDRGV